MGYQIGKKNINKSVFNSRIWCLIIYVQYMTLPLKQGSTYFRFFDFFIVGICIFYSILINGLSKRFLKYFLGILAIYSLDFLLFRNFSSFSFFLIPMMQSSLLMLYCTLNLNRIEDFESIYYKYSLGTLFSVIIYIVIYVITGNSVTSHMGIGNVLTFIFIAVLINRHRFNKSFDFLLMLFILLLTLFFANRMAIVSEIACFLFIVNYKRSLKIILKRLTITIIVIPCFIITILNIDKIFYLVSPLIDSNGEMYYSLMKFQRMFTNSDGIFAGLIQSSSGRNLLYDQAITLFRENYFFPRGIAGFYYQDISGYIFRYPHNVFLEMLTTFGFMAPFVLIFFIVYSAFRMQKMSTSHRVLTSVFMIFSVTKLLVSSSFWLAPSFAVLIGLLGVNWRKEE